MKSRMNLLTFFFLLTFIYYVKAMVYDRCELAVILAKNFQFDRKNIPNWICLIEHGSNFDTMVKKGPNKDRSHDYGLFQINDRYWCSNWRNMNLSLCGIPCEELLSNDIASSVRCAKKIFMMHEFFAWNVWKSKCKGTDVSQYVRGCEY